ncbi:G-type lectin S-receptor-like serine/threonine-protein kinase [Dorcoceras hygrometricum]|uniref:G-type lectin S-receptor-like serine/threonine-protein kinase n=1 Tax=Dorcoceras hygrometricum TaxID=472368 RepID=A0A2Z7C8K7_9LAMI|nr:G-type lectin S-receptor-like serine/threonine-protein kinase [Dorcoceras hygrometricum]
MKSQQWISSFGPGPDGPLYTPPPPLLSCAAAAAADLRRKFVSSRFDEENPFVQNSSVLLVQPDEGVSVLVMDRIGYYLPQSTEKSRVLVIPVGSRHKCQQGIRFERPMEHCDVLSMQIDSDLVIYRTTLLQTFQVVTICRVDKSEVLVVLISPHDSKLTLAMSLFDLQYVYITIGSIATLDLPMVVDLIEICGLKGPYCTLTTTNWFLQALSVIPRGSWGDVARRSYHDPMGKSGIVIPEPQWLWAHG